MGRRTAETGNPFALDQSKRLLGVEHLLKDERAAGEQRLQHVEQASIEAGRQKCKQYTVTVDAVSLVDKTSCAIRRIVQVQNGFGIAGCAGGKSCARQLVGVRASLAQLFTIDGRLCRVLDK